VDELSRHRGAKLRTQFVLSGAISLFNFVYKNLFIFISNFLKLVQTISSSLLINLFI